MRRLVLAALLLGIVALPLTACSLAIDAVIKSGQETDTGADTGYELIMYEDVLVTVETLWSHNCTFEGDWRNGSNGESLGEFSLVSGQSHLLSVPEDINQCTHGNGCTLWLEATCESDADGWDEGLPPYVSTIEHTWNLMVPAEHHNMLAIKVVTQEYLSQQEWVLGFTEGCYTDSSLANPC